MSCLAWLYILNATLLLLHEIDSADAKEWEILHLPGRITGFLLLHVPIVFLLFVGAIGVAEQAWWGTYLATLIGIGGTVPFLVHKVFARKQGYFDSIISSSIIVLNLLAGLAVVIVAAGIIKC